MSTHLRWAPGRALPDRVQIAEEMLSAKPVTADFGVLKPNRCQRLRMLQTSPATDMLCRNFKNSADHMADHMWHTCTH